MTNLEDVQNVIFDLDGTLVDSREGIFESFVYALGQKGIDFSEEDRVTVLDCIAKAMPLRDTFREIDKHFSQEKEVFTDENLLVFRNHYFEVCTKCELYDDIGLLLKNLWDGDVIMAVATSKLTKFSTKILHHLGILPYFELIVGGDQVRKWKPNPEAVLKVLEWKDWKPQVTLMVGDSVPDIRAGKGAGVRTCAVSWGFGRREDLEREEPDLLVEAPMELLEALGLDRPVGHG